MNTDIQQLSNELSLKNKEIDLLVDHCRAQHDYILQCQELFSTHDYITLQHMLFLPNNLETYTSEIITDTSENITDTSEIITNITNITNKTNNTKTAENVTDLKTTIDDVLRHIHYLHKQIENHIHTNQKLQTQQDALISTLNHQTTLLEHQNKHIEDSNLALTQLNDTNIELNFTLYNKDKEINELKIDIHNKTLQLANADKVIYSIKSFVEETHQAQPYIPLFNPAKIMDTLMVLFNDVKCGNNHISSYDDDFYGMDKSMVKLEANRLLKKNYIKINNKS